jgi:hypothetical protein
MTTTPFEEMAARVLDCYPTPVRTTQRVPLGNHGGFSGARLCVPGLSAARRGSTCTTSIAC